MKRPEPARFKGFTRQIVRKAIHRIAINLHCVQKPGFFLISVNKVVCLGQMFAHCAHFLCERFYPLKQGRAFKVLHYFMTIFDLIGTGERKVKEGLQVIFIPARRDGGYV